MKVIVAASIAFIIILALLILLYSIFSFVFCYPKKNRTNPRDIPDNIFYEDYKEIMLSCVNDMENTPYEEVSIIADDGCILSGKFYRFKEAAPVMIFFHGYHGMAEWDGYGSFKLCKESGINLLMPDERSHGKSGGNTITFGVKEKYDCKQWTDYVISRLGNKTPIILSGLSMGAASVILYSTLGLPESVKAIISDCGYTESATIIKETLKNMKLPVKPLYFLIYISARIFGHFNLEEMTPLKAVSQLNTPILFIHGSKDCVVPLAMNEELYNNCKSSKKQLIIEGANHSNCAMTDYTTYKRVVREFIEMNL